MELEREVFGLPYRHIVRIRGDISKVLAVRRKGETEVILIRELIIDALHRLVPFFNAENNDATGFIKDCQEFVVRGVLQVHHWCLKNHGLRH